MKAQEPTVSNVIGVGQLDLLNELDLEFIASKMEGSRLNTRKFSGLVVRKAKPRGTVLLFRSSKFIIVGAQTPEDSEVLSRRVAKDVKKVLSLPDVRLKVFRVCNIVAHACLGYEVDILKIAELPNAFKDDKSAGVFMKMDKVKNVVVFTSGKLMLNGATKMDCIFQVYEKLKAELLPYKLQKNTPDENQVPNKQVKGRKKRKGKAEKKQQIENNLQSIRQQIPKERTDEPAADIFHHQLKDDQSQNTKAFEPKNNQSLIVPNKDPIYESDEEDRNFP